MYLPEHEVSLRCLRLVIKDCMLITFNDKVCLLYKGKRQYRVLEDVGPTCWIYNETCLLKLPKFIKGQIIFKCYFPLCKAQISIANNHLEDLNCDQVIPSNTMHTCLHDVKKLKSRSTLLLHAVKLGGDEMNWICDQFKESKTKIRFVHNYTEVFCFNETLTVFFRDVEKKEISELMSNEYNTFSQNWNILVSRLKDKVKL